MLVAAADSATSHPYCALVDKVGQIETTGGGVIIAWDDGDTNSVGHNDNGEG
jgi:hypothetical protein